MPASQVMHKWKHGKLHSGSKSGPVVKNRAQAIAIMMSERRAEQKHGGKYPEKKAKGGHVTGLARAIDIAHRSHAGRPHPSSIDYKGATYQLGKAFGGPNLDRFNMENMVMRGSMYGLRHEGMIHSSVPGRTDRLPMSVKSGSYVLPADIPSALGQGNSMAGGKILQKMFSSGPYGMAPMSGGRGSGQPRMSWMRPPSMPSTGMGRGKTPFASGGTHRTAPGHVPIIAAGGEFLIHPDVVRDVGHGDISAGHKVLDKFVLNVRKKYAETLKKLPGPKK